MKYPRYSELMVLHSAAGFYIGQLYYESKDECVPYSRKSQYFNDIVTAENALINNSYIHTHKIC